MKENMSEICPLYDIFLEYTNDKAISHRICKALRHGLGLPSRYPGYYWKHPESKPFIVTKEDLQKASMDDIASIRNIGKKCLLIIKEVKMLLEKDGE